jgi:hypothetical protein
MTTFYESVIIGKANMMPCCSLFFTAGIQLANKEMCVDFLERYHNEKQCGQKENGGQYGIE